VATSGGMLSPPTSLLTMRRARRAYRPSAWSENLGARLHGISSGFHRGIPLTRTTGRFSRCRGWRRVSAHAGQAIIQQHRVGMG
jgi:hypothetical protein